jgi:hypothetical protein
MKKIIVMIALGLFFQTMMAAQSHTPVVVPQTVINAFTAQFPEGKLKNWESRKEGYIARFVHNGKKWFAYYSPDGKWQGTEVPVKWTRQLPDSVKTGWMNSGYGNWYVVDMKKITTPEQVMYVMHVDNGVLLDSNHHDVYKEEWLLYFSGTGGLIKKQQVN